MIPFTAHSFAIPPLTGISTKTIDEHLKLYAGYVDHSNRVLAEIEKLSSDPESNMGILSGLHRRFGFEYNGMRNHEVYFNTLSGGTHSLPTHSPLKQALAQQWGSFDAWLQLFQTIATTRGVGWAILYYDRTEKRLLNAWIDEQHLGQLQNCTPILALDMWEHSYVADYQPSGKKQYIADFFTNLNWEVVEQNFLNVQ